MKFSAWVINNRGKHDTEITMELCVYGMYGSSPQEAWKKFLLLVGNDRKHWNKLGYLAERIIIDVTFEREKA